MISDREWKPTALDIGLMGLNMEKCLSVIARGKKPNEHSFTDQNLCLMGFQEPPQIPEQVNAVQSMLASNSTIQWYPSNLLSALLSSAMSINPWHIPPSLFSKPLDHSWKPWLDLASLPAQFIEIPTDLLLLTLAVSRLHPLGLHYRTKCLPAALHPNHPSLCCFWHTRSNSILFRGN